MPTKEDMINKIYEVVGYNKYIKYHSTSESYHCETIMIGDVLDYFKIQHNFYPDIIETWREKRLPIEAQSDECIEYIYNLNNNRFLSYIIMIEKLYFLTITNNDEG